MQPSIAGARREGKPVSKPVERQRQEQKKATENNHLAKGVCCAILLSPRCFLNGVFALERKLLSRRSRFQIFCMWQLGFRFAKAALSLIKMSMPRKMFFSLR
jgi:hypothetical protein